MSISNVRNDEMYSVDLRKVIGTRRTPACILVDTSSSMAGNEEILNKTLRDVIELSCEDKDVRDVLDLSIIEFNSDVIVHNQFGPVTEVEPKSFHTTGATSLGEALNTAMNMIKNASKVYGENGQSINRPLIFIISDGMATDDINSAIERLKHYEEKKYCCTVAFGIGYEATQELARITNRIYDVNEKELKKSFEEIVRIMYQSFHMASVSRPGQSYQFPQDAPSLVEVREAGKAPSWCYSN